MVFLSTSYMYMIESVSRMYCVTIIYLLRHTSHLMKHTIHNYSMNCTLFQFDVMMYKRSTLEDNRGECINDVCPYIKYMTQIKK